MDDAKLPDLHKIREGRKRSEKLPPQASAQDTSNWEDRTFSAPNLNTDRQFEMSLPPVEGIMPNPYLEQERVKAERRNKHESSTRGLIMAPDDEAWAKRNKKKQTDTNQ